MHARITSDCDFQTIRLEIEYPLGGDHGRPHLATMHRSTELGVAPGTEWILHGCDFGCDSDVNFRCEDLTEDSAWM